MFDIRDAGIGRSLDLIMYVLYSNDQNFIKDMVCRVTNEVLEQFHVEELHCVLQCHDNLLLYKILFFMMLDFHPPFRYWVLQENNIGLAPICPFKAKRFLKILRDEIIPSFLINECMRLDEIDYKLKLEYLRS